jgi:RimJ/RimL family protein N-acetyltransferase
VVRLEWLAAQGYSPLYVGVWSGNSGAQRLYGRFGFEKIGEYDFPVGEHLDREYILRRPTIPPPAPGGS